MPAQQQQPSSSSRDKETEAQVQSLDKLIKLLNVPASKQQLPSLELEENACRQSLQWPAPQPKKSTAYQHQSTEAVALEQFSATYQTERKFSKHLHQAQFSSIFSALVEQRLTKVEWSSRAPPENILRVLVCLRILMRDSSYQRKFFQEGAVKHLSEHLQKATDSYLTYGDGPFVVDILKEMTNIFGKLSSVVDQREKLITYGSHKSLVLLLSATDVIVLHCSLHALISLAQSPGPRSSIAELSCIEILLHILQDYDFMSKNLAANLLRALCSDSQAREMIKVYDGIPLLLSLLHGDNIRLLWCVVWCLVQIAEDPDASNDIRIMGGLPLILTLLSTDRKFVSDRSSSTTGTGSVHVGHVRMGSLTSEEEFFVGPLKDSSTSPNTEPANKKMEEVKELHWSLKSACCAALTELARNDSNAQHIVQANGVYTIGLLILPQEGSTERQQRATQMLQANAFRTLRWLFSMERNRRLFKRIFPPKLFEKFIDIGHYVRDINAYLTLVSTINSLPEDVTADIQENLNGLNQNKAPSHFIREYAVIDHLGAGNFGAVYKVKKGQALYAMKEIFTQAPTLGKNAKERDKSVGEIISELTIIREQLKHPNIVKYHKTFTEQDKLYIVMELIEGAPLDEHISSLREKKEHFTEQRVWGIFIQMVLGLRYLHKEKRILHRDLKPSNIMLGENDKVTITDFGLAKQKRKDNSKMMSVVGTMVYFCPEIIQNEPYGEKADVWASGCILYEMCKLQPPFSTTNMLSLATKIVSAEYEPLPEDGKYSEKIQSTIKYCLTADPQARPDIVQVASNIADIMLLHMDNQRQRQISLEKKLERERKRTQRNLVELNRNMQNYHRLFLASQERYDKLVNLSGSGGGEGLKDDTDLGDLFTDTRGIKPPVINTADIEAANNNCWYSDEDLGDSCSSGSESRESSAGASRLRGNSADGALPRPPKHGTPRTRRKPRCIDTSQALTVEIPPPNALDRLIPSRDSGFSSGDGSPFNSTPPSCNSSVTDSLRGKPPSGVSRSVSVDTTPRRLGSGGKSRPSSASQATLSISPRKVRQISDPILQMLHQLHKLLYITQLPPTLCPNPRRKVIERFKRALFAPQSTSLSLKNELKKLVEGCQDVIDLNLGPSEAPLLLQQASRECEALTIQANTSAITNPSYEEDASHAGMTYEQMQTIIETVLVESGYYDMSPNAQNRSLPLGPITLPEPKTTRTIHSAS